MTRTFIGLALASLPVLAGGQQPLLTLDDALEIALLQNRAVANAELEAAEASDELAALKTLRYPRLDLRGAYSKNFEDQEFTFDQGVWGTYDIDGQIIEVPSQDITIDSTPGSTAIWSAGVTQPIAQQYKLSLSVERGEIIETMATEKVRLTQQDLARLVKQDYFNIVQTQSDIVANEESVEFYKSLNELVGNYVKEQVALDYELQEVEARLARRQFNGTRLHNHLTTLKERLNNLLARDLNTPFEVQQMPPPQQTATSEEEAVAMALQQRPDMVEANLAVKEAQLGYDIKRAEYIPDPDIHLRYARRYDYELIPDKEAYVGLQAKWEFYDWGRKSRELDSRNSSIRQAMNDVEHTENSVVIDVRKSYRAIAEAEESVAVAELSRNAAREKLRVLMNRYRQQSALLQDVLEAETDLDRTNNEYNRAILDVWKAQAELDRAVGEI